MKKNIFLSVAWPYRTEQVAFMERIQAFFERKGYALKTVDIKQYSRGSTMDEVQKVMEKCDGVIVLAFRRMEIHKATIRPNSDLDKNSKRYKESEYIIEKYKTSDWCNVELGMAFGMKLPILLFLDDFLIDQSIYMDDDIQVVKFNLEKEAYLKSEFSLEWQRSIDAWIKCLQSRGE